MDYGAENGELVARVVLQGVVFFLKISGQAAEAILAFLAAALSQKTKVLGKTSLKNLLQSGSELKIFTIRGEDNFRQFLKEAKNYGMLYSVVSRTKGDKELGIYDVMVRAEDAAKLNRIIEKHHFAEVAATTKAVSKEEAERAEIIEARDVLSKMLATEVSGNPEEALEGPSRSDALLRMPNQENRSSVIKEMEGYAAAEGKKESVQRTILPNLMVDEEEEKKQRKLDEPDDAKAILSKMLRKADSKEEREV